MHFSRWQQHISKEWHGEYSRAANSSTSYTPPSRIFADSNQNKSFSSRDASLSTSAERRFSGIAGSIADHLQCQDHSRIKWKLMQLKYIGMYFFLSIYVSFDVLAWGSLPFASVCCCCCWMNLSVSFCLFLANLAFVVALIFVILAFGFPASWFFIVSVISTWKHQQEKCIDFITFIHLILLTSSGIWT